MRLRTARYDILVGKAEELKSDGGGAIETIILYIWRKPAAGTAPDWKTTAAERCPIQRSLVLLHIKAGSNARID